ncbi:MAG: hypothetical protein GDA41_09470 [Rhodospirillales bacterium]|nr:hypothetical protein [Rhodospirillales bacterium]
MKIIKMPSGLSSLTAAICIHIETTSKTFLLVGGFTNLLRRAPLTEFFTLCEKIFNLCFAAKTYLNMVRRRLGLSYWSLSAYLQLKVKNALQFIDNYETAVAEEARKRCVDGMICGHIHHAEMRNINGILYCNNGDWVEICTAPVEHLDERLKILCWAEERSFSMLPQTMVVDVAA